MSKTSTLHEYARIGAGVRLNELRAEVAAITKAFPDLADAPARRRQGRPPGRPKAAIAESTEPVAQKRKRRKMSAAGRKAISDAQKARWAKLRATQR